MMPWCARCGRYAASVEFRKLPGSASVVCKDKTTCAVRAKLRDAEKAAAAK